MGFEQGLSGLNASSKTLEAIGNNIANANTVGFKASDVQFADVYAASLSGGGGGTNTGTGVKVAQVTQQFNQGNVTATNNPLDMAINGGGFFRMAHLGTVAYARNGQFQLDKDGFIINATGDHLTGYIANSAGVLSTGSPVDLFINAADQPPNTTTKITAQLNLDSTGTVPLTSTFNPTDPTSYNNATSLSVYDSLGNSHLLQTFYVKSPVANQWTVYATNDGVPIKTLGAVGPNAVAGHAVAAGTIVAGGAAAAAAGTLAAGALTFTTATGGTIPVVDPVTGGTITLPGATAAANGTAIAAAITAALAKAPGGAAVNGSAASAAGVITITAGTDAIQMEMGGVAPDLATANANGTALALKTGFTFAAPPAAALQLGTQAYGATDTLNFKTDGSLDTAASPMPVAISLSVATGATTPININLDYTGITQFGAAFSVNSLSQDGFTSGRLTGINTASDGTITGRYTNGQAAVLGQVVLANFRNPNGLQPLGNNTWAETATSGVPLVGTPNSGSLGVLQPSAVEDSNVDLTNELVRMITAQRNYQANAQTIKTQDQILQTLVNL